MPINRKALVAEGQRLLKDQDASGWRLAEIVHELREDGMTYQAIADNIGWKLAETAARHDIALSYDQTEFSFSDAYALAKMREDDAEAVRAISEAQDIAISTAKRTRIPETKAIAAGISDLPQEEKSQVARDLAGDPGFMADALAQHSETREKEKQEETRRDTPPPTPVEKAINTARLRIAVNRVEEAAQAVLDGVNRSDLDDEDIASLEASAKRCRITADYIEAILGAGDPDEALKELLS